MQVQESRIKELEARLNQNSKYLKKFEFKNENILI